MLPLVCLDTTRPRPINSRCSDVGGAVRLGGVADVQYCSFLANSATSRGPAVAVVTSASANVSESSFDGNELYCGAGLYRQDTNEVKRKRSVRTRTPIRFASVFGWCFAVRSLHLSGIFGSLTCAPLNSCTSPRRPPRGSRLTLTYEVFLEGSSNRAVEMVNVNIYTDICP